MTNIMNLPEIIGTDDRGHIGDHTVLHKAIKTHESRLNLVSSGFPTRAMGERTRNDKKEVGLLRKNTTTEERFILAEVTESAGILKHIWYAAQCADESFLLENGEVLVYIDNATVPSFTSKLGMFFPATNIDENYANERIGRGDGNGQADSSSGFRYLHIPFENYMRVEIANYSAENALVYGSANYSLLDNLDGISEQKNYKIESTGGVVENQDLVTIIDKEGSGQIESIVLKYLVNKTNQAPVLEGPVNVWIDGVLAQRYSGIEDVFNGGWYKVPAGAYPAGITSNSSPEGYTLYRFFQNAPIFFEESIKITVGIGQVNQGVVNESTDIVFKSNVGYWLDTAAGTTGPSLGPTVYSTDFANMDGWFNAGGRTPFSIVDGKAKIVEAGTAEDEDARIFRPEMELPADYWIETKVRVTGTGEQEAFLGIEGAYDVYYGSAVHVQLKKSANGSFEVVAKDDFDIHFTEVITTGGVIDWVHLALRKYDGRVTAYSSFDGEIWSPLGAWNPTKSGSSIALGVWGASAEFDSLTIKAVV